MALKLYDLCGRDERLCFSPYCWRVRMALAHKGLEFTTVVWRFLDKKALEFADYDKVPVLCDGDQVVTDSFEIMRYLDKAYPDAPMLGEGASYQRVLLFKYFVERSVTPALFRIIAMDLLAAIHPDDRLATGQRLLRRRCTCRFRLPTVRQHDVGERRIDTDASRGWRPGR